MGRSSNNIYIFISDENGKFKKAIQQRDGSYLITSNKDPYPIKYNPSNLLKSQMEFATNQKYNSVVRTVSYPLDFIKDGAAILRDLYYNKKNINQKAYVTIVEWNGSTGVYELSYYGRVDFKEKTEDPKSGVFTVPCVDDSAWGVLSQNDGVVYSVDCSPTNPKSIRVLLDGITLLNKYTFQTVDAPVTDYDANQYHYIPFVLVNQDGDSSGIISQSQSSGTFNNLGQLATSPNYFLNTFYAINNVNLTGKITFSWSTNTLPSGDLEIYFYTSRGNKLSVTPRLHALIPGKIYSFDFDFTFNLAVDERIFFIAEMNDNAARAFTINPIVTNIYLSTKTIQEPFVAYGLRPLDLIQEIVNQATNGRFTINSDWFTVNNKDICLSGDSIRGVANSRIYSSFEDFFKTFNAVYFMALRVINGELWMEKFTTVYGNTANTIIDLGECIDVKLSSAVEYYCNRIKVGSPKQDYRHPSGRLEFNSENLFSLPFTIIDKELEILSRYRLGCYDIQFLLLDYKGGSSQDNTGDKSTYMVKITDELDNAVDDVETFENVTVDDAPLQPIIKTPLDNDRILNDKPTVTGIAPPGSNVNIYVDTVLDGSTTSDANGNFSYDIVNPLSSFNPGIDTGIHTIQATYTDLSAPNSSITVTIDTTIVQPIEITYPQINSSLYNNKPLITGVAPAGTNIDISINGVLVASVVTDNSCRWKYKSGVIANGLTLISVNSASATVRYNTDSFTQYPLITFIGSEIDGFPIINNFPLIEGVGIPGTLVTIWLNYISYASIGTATIDANGNWSIQTVFTSYLDPLSGIPVTVVPIRNGLSIISTSLVNFTVGINTIGYKLSRPAYQSITGVIDNTVFNTEYSPKRMLMEHKPILAAILARQLQSFITFQKADKNGNLATLLNGVSVIENENVPLSSLGTPIALLEYALIKTKTSKTFAKTLYDFSNGGVISATFRGTKLYCLPIGSMKIDNVSSDVQEWKLLVSTLTTYTQLLNLYKNGLTINLNAGQMYHSDYNTLHFVDYNFQPNVKYNFKTIYNDWFANRNDAWLYNPDYIQKVQRTDPIRDQIVTNGISGATLKMFRCLDGTLVDSKNYNPVGPAPIPLPDIVSEAVYDMTAYPEDQYFFVPFVGDVPCGISERIETKDKWLDTILIEAGNSINLVGFFPSTGIQSVIRVEGLVKKIQPSVESVTANEEDGTSQLLYGQISRKRTIRFGTAYGLPDYLYLKVAGALLLDELKIEGVSYTFPNGEEISPSDDVPGHPLYYYNVNLLLSENNKGNTLPGSTGEDISGIVLVVDAEAFGMPRGSLINIKLD